MFVTSNVTDYIIVRYYGNITNYDECKKMTIRFLKLINRTYLRRNVVVEQNRRKEVQASNVLNVPCCCSKNSFFRIVPQTTDHLLFR